MQLITMGDIRQLRKQGYTCTRLDKLDPVAIDCANGKRHDGVWVTGAFGDMVWLITKEQREG